MTGARDGFVFPPGWSGPTAREVETVQESTEVELCWPRLDPAQATSLLEALVAAGQSLSKRPAASIPATLGAVGARFGDRGDALHAEAVEWVAGASALSQKGASQIVRGMAREWTADRLRRALLADFPDPGMLDGFREGTEESGQRAMGGRLALHLCSGNVPGVGATSLVRSLLVKCPVLLKPGLTDVALTVLFARALADEDADLAGAVAVAYWPRHRGGPLFDLALNEADRVVVYGANGTVAELRDRTPVSTPFVAYHHRLSLGAVGREALATIESARSIAGQAARAIAAYDASGCASPKIVWVERGGRVSPEAWSEILAAEMAVAERRVPAGRVGDADAASLRQLAETVAIRRAAGEEVTVHHAPDLSWLVVCGPEDLAPSVSAGRAVLICPIEGLEALPGRLGASRGSLQSVALAVEPARRSSLAEDLARVGVSRITTFERIAWPPAWWRHDGRGPLSPLVRWTIVEEDDPASPAVS